MTPVEVIFGLSGLLLLVAWPLPLLLTAITHLSGNSVKAPFGYHWLVLLTGWWSFQLGLGLAVGAIGLFNAPVIFSLQFALFIAGMVSFRRINVEEKLSFFSWMLPHRSLNTVESSVGFVLLLAFFLGIFQTIKNPTSEFDSLAYHLPVMANWVQQGNLWGFVEIGHVGMYPSHFELLSALFFFPWNSSLMVGFPSILAWVYAGNALYVFARLCGAGATASLSGTALFLLLPDFQDRFEAIQPDLALVALWLCVAIALIRWANNRHLLDLCFGLLSIGLLLGLKLSALLHLLVLIVPLGLYFWQTVKPKVSFPRNNQRWILMVLVLSSVLAGSWYVRNLIQTQNPAGLVQIEIFGKEFFEGTLARSELVRGSLARVFQPGVQHDWQVLGTVLWLGFGPAGLALLLLAVAGLLFKPVSKILPRGLLLVLLLCELALYWTAPFSADNGSHGFQITPWLITGLRYGYLVMALLSVLAAMGIQKYSRQGTWVGLILVVGCGLWLVKNTSIANPVALWICIALALLVFFVLSWKAIPSIRALTLFLGSCVLLLGGLVVILFPAHMDLRAKLYGPAGQFLENQDDQRPVAVINSQELIRYAGQNWTRPVSMALPEKNVSAGKWLSDLQSQGFKWLVFGTAGLDKQGDFVNQLAIELDRENSNLKMRVQETGFRQDERLYEIGNFD